MEIALQGMNVPRHIVLVGCGFSGTSAFFQLVDQYAVEKITIFEATGDFGPGYAYRTNESQDYLINNTTDTMCLVPSNRRAFVTWLQARPDLAPELDESGHLPRPVYGTFLKDVFAATRTNAAIKGIAVELISHSVTDIAETGETVRITWDGGSIDADAVVLTTGRSKEYQPFPMPRNDGAKYFASHLKCPNLDEIPMSATVHIMGASLSAYDVLNRLFADTTGCRFERSAAGELTFVPGSNLRHAVLCSRNGRLKAMQSRHDIQIKRTAFTREHIRNLYETNSLDLHALGNLIIRDASANEAQLDYDALLDPYGNCESAEEVNSTALSSLERAIRLAKGDGGPNFLVDFFSDAQVDLWDIFAEHLLSAQDEATYRSRLETAVLCFAAPCPIPTAEKILALLKAGRLRIVKGVSQVSLNEDGGPYQIKHNFGVERADILVNTIGAVNRSVQDPSQDELTRNLAQKGYLQPYVRDGVKLPGADIDMTTFRLKGSERIYAANMMLWGPGFFTSSAFMMATIVERLLKAMFRGADNHTQTG